MAPRLISYKKHQDELQDCIVQVTAARSYRTWASMEGKEEINDCSPMYLRVRMKSDRIITMNASNFVRSPVKVNGGLPMSLSPGLGATCGAGTAGGNPPPPPPPPPPHGGTPPGIPGIPPPGILADWMWNPCPENGCVGGSGQSGWRARSIATSSLVYMCPVRGLIAPSLIVVVVVCASVIGKSSMWSSAASLVMALIAGAWCT